jgi:hypothetical protein
MQRPRVKAAASATLAAAVLAGWALTAVLNGSAAEAATTAAQTAMAANLADHEADADYVWNAGDVVPIALNGSSASASGGNVSISGTTVTITAAGTYQLTGTLTNGRVVVNSTGSGIVRLLLNGATITNSTTSPLDIEAAEKALVFLNAGTTNSLSDATTYVYPDAATTEPDAALFSKANLTLAGTGSLTVRGNAYDGIASKDGLIIHSGTLNVTAKDDGVRGKDYLVVDGGSITVSSTSDALKSTNDSDATAGYVNITGGTLGLTATGGDAISAETDVIVQGGTITAKAGAGSSTAPTATSTKGLKAGVNVIVSDGTVSTDSSDDGVNSNATVIIDGGSVTVATADDGVHADTALNVLGGMVNVTKSYEGVEAMQVTISGGNVRAVASDDAFNAAEEGIDEFAVAPNAFIRISGGTVVVDGGTDGLDSNGTMTLSGGTIVVAGSATRGGGEGGLDANGTLSLTGGIIFSSGLNATTGTIASAGQGRIAYSFSGTQAAGTTVHVATTSGTELVAFKSTKAFQKIVFSSYQLVPGTTYAIYTGGSVSGASVGGGLYTTGGSLSGASQVGTAAATGTTTGAATTRPATTTGAATSRPATTTRPVTTTGAATTRPATTTGAVTTRPATTTGAGTAGCTATYSIVGSWQGGFQGNVRVTAGSAAISAWTVTWTFANGQTVSQAWGATVTASGSAVTAKNVSYNGSLAAGAGTDFGFIGTWTGTNAVPTVSCTAN